MRKFIYSYKTDIGYIAIAEYGSAITEIYFQGNHDDQLHKSVLEKDYVHKETWLLSQASQQLLDYLDGERYSFDLPLAPEGTAFQQRVWTALQDIPYAQTNSYKDIAIAIGNEKAFRAVGMANNRNPIPIIIPCHRVIGANGKLLGYGGGLHIKKHLLALEKQHCTNI